MTQTQLPLPIQINPKNLVLFDLASSQVVLELGSHDHVLSILFAKEPFRSACEETLARYGSDLALFRDNPTFLGQVYHAIGEGFSLWPRTGFCIGNSPEARLFRMISQNQLELAGVVDGPRILYLRSGQEKNEQDAFWEEHEVPSSFLPDLLRRGADEGYTCHLTPLYRENFPG